MKQHDAIQIFEDKKVRTLWDEAQEKWYISIVDVVEILTESSNARKYWSVLKTRLKAEGSQLATNCSQLWRNNIYNNVMPWFRDTLCEIQYLK